MTCQVFRDKFLYEVSYELFRGGLRDVDGEDTEPFRVWCGLVGELRSLFSAPLLALTATASSTTKERIIRCLGMTDRCYEITQSPDRDNTESRPCKHLSFCGESECRYGVHV